MSDQLLVDSSNGIYIPKMFAEIAHLWDGIDSFDIDILLEGPDNVYYWDAWETVLSEAFVLDTEGRKWVLYQDGDLWACTEDSELIA